MQPRSADALSGRYLSVNDDAEDIARHAEAIRRDDLYPLRLRTFEDALAGAG